MKEITIAIPDGKKAVWAEDGKLTLVPDMEETAQPKKDDRPITERVQTFEDACRELSRRAEQGDETAAGLLCDYDSNHANMLTPETIAFMQLCIIAAAINEGWKPEFTEDEERWYPWHYFYTKDELEKMNDSEKDRRKMLLLWGGAANDGTYAGLGYAYSFYAFSDTDAAYGSRLACETEAKADFFGKQFIGIWCQFYTGKEGTPWRNS